MDQSDKRAQGVTSVTLDNAVIFGELQEVKRALEELKERLMRAEDEMSVLHAGCEVMFHALELNGLLTGGEPTKPATKQKEPTATVKEETFTTLTFEDKQGEKLGQYAVAFKKSNSSDKFQSAYNILRQSNATISKRYCGTGYAFSYWLYDSDDRIFRQKLKPKTEASQ